MNVWVHRRMVVIMLGVAFGLALVFAPGRASSAASPNGVAPEPLAGDRVEEDACPDFAVNFEWSGKEKIIAKPDGSLLIPQPGLSVTLTNVEEPDNQVTVHNNSAWQEKPLPDGTTLEVISGPVLSWPPLQLLHGRQTALLDSEGELIEEVSSQGNAIDLCALLA